MEITKDTDPNQLFSQWFESAKQADEVDLTAMTLSTVDQQGWACSRVVLLKQHDEKGFCFFTNYNSPKSQQLIENEKTSLVFHWRTPFHRQVRIRGMAEKMTYEESNAYFQSRERGSQIGAWASPQSSEIQGREELVRKAQELEEKYKDQVIPCPEHWGGFRIQALVIEFWQEQDHRLHDRFQFSRSSLQEPWQLKRLAP